MVFCGSALGGWQGCHQYWLFLLFLSQRGVVPFPKQSFHLTLVSSRSHSDTVFQFMNCAAQCLFWPGKLFIFLLFSSSVGKHSRESTFWDCDAFPFEILISVIFSLSPLNFCLVFSVLGHIGGPACNSFFHLVSSHPFVETSWSCCFSSQVTLLPKCQSWVWLCAYMSLEMLSFPSFFCHFSQVADQLMVLLSFDSCQYLEQMLPMVWSLQGP